ncbi:MAG: hypothetical protein AB7V42_14700 [Thermoleophilia bacterium]
MPVPRLFEVSNDPREQWVHVLATLLALGGPDTRTALVEEVSGEALPEADAILVREQREIPDADGLVADIVARGAGWTLAVQATLAFDADEEALLAATYDALSAAYDKIILVALTPDRKPPASVTAAAAGGRTIRHLSWLRLRDWVQERPERGRVHEASHDALLLREAEYFLTPRVAELYRLEGLMPLVDATLRPSLAGIFFDLNELAPAPLIQNEEGAARVAFPRTGDPQAEIALEGGALRLRVATAEGGPGFAAAGEGWALLDVAAPASYLAARGWTQTTARSLLPARR